MRKLYTEPELELISIRLLADVLGPSMDLDEDESDVQDSTTGFNPGGGDIPDIPDI